MSEQLDLLEEIADQSAAAGNVGTSQVKYRPKRRGLRLSVSPALARAKVARPAKDSPATSASPPEAVPEMPVTPAGPFVRLARTKHELVAVLRARKEALNLSHEKIDQLVGWAERLSTKALAPVPKKGMSGEMLQVVMDALGLGLAAVVLVEDPEQSEKMRPRWTPRGPSGPRPDDGALFSESGPDTIKSTTEDHDGQTPHQLQAER